MKINGTQNLVMMTFFVGQCFYMKLNPNLRIQVAMNRRHLTIETEKA